jgi:broad specificity phosphatase PhoE
MILDVVRHGATATNLAGRFNVEDEGLPDKEFQRLRRAAFHTGGYRQIYVSPLRRCLDTAIALGLHSYKTDARLGERRFGVFAGLSPAECLARHGKDFEAFSLFDADFVIPEGESRSQHYARLVSWLAEIDQVADDPVLAVTHGGTVDFLYRLATGRPLHGGEQIHAGQNARLSRFRLEGERIQLIQFSAPLLGEV